MIKLKIDNWFQKPEDYERIVGQDPNGGNIYRCHDFANSIVAPYDMEKWKDGKEYTFDTLKELQKFVDTCDIDFKDAVKARFSNRIWTELDRELCIDASEDNTMIFTISCHDEWRD